MPGTSGLLAWQTGRDHVRTAHPSRCGLALCCVGEPAGRRVCAKLRDGVSVRASWQRVSTSPRRETHPVSPRDTTRFGRPRHAAQPHEPSCHERRVHHEPSQHSAVTRAVATRAAMRALATQRVQRESSPYSAATRALVTRRVSREPSLHSAVREPRDTTRPPRDLATTRYEPSSHSTATRAVATRSHTSSRDTTRLPRVLAAQHSQRALTTHRVHHEPSPHNACPQRCPGTEPGQSRSTGNP